ncbi:sugar phosphate isomerase/epimerase [Sphaerochaeta sp. PS]|uniref:sugar phosphate isomerase/epimerase family protein n=1 Tax=Sphaerochaeta sp. PS TaxID=3076336 RepID=UPI0028A493A8|nr:sugar phosphate isomerase/epimerase [Sphaerochaeta sp. PS]MDT4761132.1 sugar phosphate isomerase/epimerase [Sphaerochaeta sp. PS]
MRIGINTWVWVSPFRSENFNLLPKVKEMGYDVIEIALDDASIIDARLLKKMLDDNGLEATVCGAFGPSRDISHEDPAIRKIGKDYILEGIRFAEKIGSNLFSGPVYSSVGKTRMISEDQKKREWQWCVENLRDISKTAQASGITIGVEPLNRFESDMINLVDQAVTLIHDVNSPVYKIHIDTFHGNIEEKSIPATIRKLGKGMLGHFHACENDRGTPGTGHQDWAGISSALKDIEYNGVVVIESFTPGAVEIAKAASIWRPLAPSQDELAREGAKFLRKTFCN